MARKKRESGGPGSGDWLNTYADMVTLLLTFFILLFSMSSLDAAKFNMLVTAFASDGESSDKIIIRGEASGTEQNADQSESADLEITDLEEIFQLLSQMVQDAGQADSVSVSKGEGYVFIQFMDDMLFEPNSSILKAQDRALLDFVGTSIKQVQDDAIFINIVGHTAAIPEQPDYQVSDRILSTERANAVLMYFEDDIGVDPLKMFATGYGKWKPLPEYADNATEESRSKNRRVEILISSEGNSLSKQLDNIYEKLVE